MTDRDRTKAGLDEAKAAQQTSVSAYDLLPQEDREAIEWVRRAGGLYAVSMELDLLHAVIAEVCTRIGVRRAGELNQDVQSIYLEIDRLKSRLEESVPRVYCERRLADRQRQIDECHAALRRRKERIKFLVSELNRAHNENHEEFMRRAGDYTAFADEACKRLAPKLRYMEGCSKDVMDAALNALDRRLMPEGMEWPRFDSGELVDFGDEVAIDGDDNASEHVDKIEFYGDQWRLFDRYGNSITEDMMGPGDRVKRPDSWERLEEDAEGIRRDIAMYLGDYSQSDFEEPGDSVQSRVVDLVRRARALAERGWYWPKYCSHCGAKAADR